MIHVPELTLRLARLKPGRPVWLTYTIPWDQSPLLNWLEMIPESPRIYWEADDQHPGFVGWGVAGELTDWGENRFHDIQAQADYLSGLLYPLNPDLPEEAGPHWLGSFSFQPLPVDDRLWRAFPDAYFLLPKVQIIRWQGQNWLTVNLLTESVDDPGEIERYFLAEIERMQEWSLQILAGSAEQLPSPEPEISEIVHFSEWQAMVDGALQQIRAGELKKVVLARTLQASFKGPAPIEKIMRNLADRYPDCYRFLVEPKAGQAFLGASPELLAEVYAPRFRSTALAGTTRRGVTPEEDRKLGEELLASPKEREEHAIVVNTLEARLSALAEQVRVAPHPELRKLGNLQHIETAIDGELKPGWGVLDVVAALHPTPALGGWPQEQARAFIAQAEPFSRGWYAAPIGWFNPVGNGLFAVGIRSALFVDQVGTLFAGAGIVEESQAQREWQETELKFIPLLDALKGTTQHG